MGGACVTEDRWLRSWDTKKQPAMCSERGWQRGWHQQEVGGWGEGGASKIQDQGELLWLEHGVRADIPHGVTGMTRGRSERACPPRRRSADLFSGCRDRVGEESDGSSVRFGKDC